MATVKAPKAVSTVPARVQVGETVVVSEFTVPATGDGTAAADIIEMVKVPKGATVTSVELSSSDVDTNATPLHSMSVGDGGDADRFILASTIGRAGGVARMDNYVGHGHKYTADDTIDITVVAAAATKAAGTHKLTVRYTLDP